MDVTLYGRMAGVVKAVDFKKSSEETTIMVLRWTARNECNDGEQEYSESVVLSTEELRKLNAVL